MPQLEVTLDQIVQLIQELPPNEKRLLLEKLNKEQFEELPPYDWDESEIPQGKAVQYIPGSGFVIEGGR